MRRRTLLGLLLILLLTGLLASATACNNISNVPEAESAPPELGMQTPEASGSGAGAGEGRQENADGSTIFHRYTGPVFTLSVIGETNEVTASRHTTFTFDGSSGIPAGRYDSGDLCITDSYSLTNDTERDVEVRILYPFSGCITDLSKILPVISLDGSEQETNMLVSAYSGSFISWDGTTGIAANPQPINSWEAYVELFSDGRYLERSLEETPNLDQLVTVYEFSNARVNSTEAAVAPTLAASFYLDESKTTVLTYMFNGCEGNDGYMRQSFFIPEEWRFSYGRSFYMLVLGDDIYDMDIQGYKNGGCYEGEELNGVTADVLRYEMSLGDILDVILSDFMEYYYDGHVIVTDDRRYAEPLDMGVIYKATVDHMRDYGILSDNIAWRYTMGMGFYDFLVDVIALDRVFYLTADITIPAGSTVEITVDMLKPGSYNFYGFGSDDMGVFGYDILTQLNDNLPFTEMTAELIGATSTDIIRQNFGFDPGNGVLDATLDLSVPHYYMETRNRGA